MINIRSSILPDYFDCPRRSACRILKTELKAAGYSFRYTPNNAAAAVGAGVHSGAEFALDSLIDARQAAKTEDCIEKGICEFRDRMAAGLEFDDTTPNINHAEKQIQLLTKSFVFEVLPKYELIDPDTEFQMEAEILPGITLTGRPDFINYISLRDLKTGRISDYSAQVGAYSLLNVKMGYERPQILTNDFLPRTAIDKAYPGPKIITYKPAEAEKIAYKIVNHVSASINSFKESGDPWCFPANPKSVLCSPKYCAAFGTAFCEMGVEK